MKHFSGSLSVASAPVFPAVAVEAPPVSGSVRKNVKLVDRAAVQARRLQRFAQKRTAANLLKGHDEKLACRLSACCYVSFAESVELVKQTRANGDVSAVVRGLVTCQSVWSCPICSARISTVRRAELNHLLAYSRAEGHSVVMLTLTARHNRSTELVPFLSAMKRAGQILRQSRGWRALGLVGSVAAQEVTHGARNGWHVHSHLLLVVPGSPDAALAAVEGLRSEWLRSLGKVSLTGETAAFQVQSAAAAGEYIAKFGAAEELALGHVKQGRGASRTPWQLLRDAAEGDRQAGVLFREYSLAFKGRRQLVWSRGLKALCGLNDISDAEISDGSAPENEVVSEETVRVWGGSSDCWRMARRRLCALLDAVENGSCIDRSEYGVSDAERWRDEVKSSQLIDCDD